MRKDLNMRKGKMVAQGAHASISVIMNNMNHTGNNQDERWELNVDINSPISEWLNGSFTKICVSVDSERELLDIYHAGIDAELPTSIIKDNGTTEFNGIKTYTAVAIGPAKSEEIDKITGGLKLL